MFGHFTYLGKQDLGSAFPDHKRNFIFVAVPIDLWHIYVCHCDRQKNWNMIPPAIKFLIDSRNAVCIRSAKTQRHWFIWENSGIDKNNLPQVLNSKTKLINACRVHALIHWIANLSDFFQISCAIKHVCRFNYIFFEFA